MCAIANAAMYSIEQLTSKFNDSSVTTTQSSRVGHLTVVDTNIRFCQDTDSQHATSFTRESDGVVVHPSVGVAAHGDASCDSTGEVGGVSHHNPHESRCDLHLGWYCSRERSERKCMHDHERILHGGIDYSWIGHSKSMTKQHV